MQDILIYGSVALISAMLIWGCITDIKIREVSNWVSVGILVAGLFTPYNWSYKLVSMAVLIATFVVGALLGIRHGMGDVKVITSLSFAIGALNTMLAVVIGGVFALIYGLIRRLPAKRSIPLVSYLCFGFFTLMVICLFVFKTLLF